MAYNVSIPVGQWIFWSIIKSTEQVTDWNMGAIRYLFTAQNMETRLIVIRNPSKIIAAPLIVQSVFTMLTHYVSY